MTNDEPRYSKLAPLSLEQRFNLSVAAFNFFNIVKLREMSALIGIEPVENKHRPLDSTDFIHYLEKTNKLDAAGTYFHRIHDLLTQLEHAQLLVRTGGNAMFGVQYVAMYELTKKQKEGGMWLATALGPEYLRFMCGGVTLLLTGINDDGDVHAGTGIVIAPRWILTCAHVVNDMQLDQEQTFYGKKFNVLRTLPHTEHDVALVEVEEDLITVSGISFRDPVITEVVYTLGYPSIPLSREPALIMQKGEITNPELITLHGEEVFLYSAIARPGNSGGPLISADGYVVGIVTKELFEETSKSGMPFHAGISTSVLATAVSDLEPLLHFPVEAYE